MRRWTNCASRITEQYSRIPAYDGDIDSITGFVHVRDMRSKLDEEERKAARCAISRGLIRLVPETKPVNDFSRDAGRRRHMAAVVDEYGSTAGSSPEDMVEGRSSARSDERA